MDNSPREIRLSRNKANALFLSLLINTLIFVFYPMINEFLHKVKPSLSTAPIEVTRIELNKPPPRIRKTPAIIKRSRLLLTPRIRRSLDLGEEDPQLLAGEADIYVPETPYEIGEVDEPPQIIDYTKPRYPKVAERNGLEGTVILRILINDRGVVLQARIVEIRGFQGFGTAAVQAVRQWRFRPAMIKDNPVAVWCTQEIRFEIKDIEKQ
ncbi:MAG: energy transducer TonB [Deltaproteobacteria bacterium]|nr:MAG: energy transducer TonB [Deltaproteobacteria bacterium]